MSSKFKTVLTQSDIFAMDTLIYSLISSNLPELTSITIIIILFAYFFVDELFFEHVLFLFDLADYLGCLLVPAQRTFHHSVVLYLVFGPLTETVEMEGVPANRMA